MATLVRRTLGEFILREQIGEGGYGAVYRCEQPALKRDVVIKMLHERRRGNDAARDRFLREAQLASLLDHPYAAHIYAFGAEDDGLLWIAMELVQGVTLDGWLRQRGPMPLEQFVPFFECVAEVVQAAHERGIVHRDLKPSNVMVLERGGRLFPKLLDFGIAKLSNDVESPVRDDGSSDADGTTTARIRPALSCVKRTASAPNNFRLTRTGSGMGSSPYMSPEQWSRASTVGPATDIYSLGIVAYEALTGRRPFIAESTDEYHRQHLHAEMVPLGGEFAPELDGVIRRAIAKRPDERHGSARELASELRAALRTQPREQLRSLAQVWDDRSRSPALLLRGGDLLRAPSGVIGELESAFVAASQRHVARHARRRRFLVASAAVLVLGGVWYRGELKADLAEERARTAALEQGRSALLHNEAEAQIHLADAYRRDPSPATAFMLARAIQPRLAEKARLTSSFGRMWSAMFSPDGTRIVTADDKNAQVWDARTHRPLFTLAHGDTVYQAVYSTDGKRLVTAAGDGAVRFWDAGSGRLVRELRRDGAKPRFVVAAASPDGKLIAAMDLGAAQIWDADTGITLAELRDESPAGFPSLAFSADGRWLAMSTGNDVRVFDTATRAQVLSTGGPAVYCLSWDPTGPRIVTGGADGDVSIWEVPSGRRVHHLRDIGEPVDAVAFSPDGQLVVAASRDGAQQVWKATSGKLQSQGNYLRGKILSIEFDRTSTLIVAAGASGTVAIADAVQGMPISMLDGPRNVVMVAHFDPRSTQVIGASWDGTARLWDATSQYRAWSSPPISADCGLVTSLEPDRRILAVGCRNHPTHVWDTTRGKLLAELPSVTQVEGDFASAYPATSPDGDRAAIARGNTVEVYELPGGRLLRTILHGAPVNAVAFASTGRDIISGAIDGSVLVARDNGALLTLPRSSSGVDVAGFLPDGRVLVADAQRHLRIYDPSGRILADLETSARVRTLRTSSDSRRLVTVPSFMGTAASPELWDVERYRRVAQLEAQGQTYSARFVGTQILTADGDGTARLWDGATGRLRQTYRGGSRFIVDVTRSMDGSMVIGGGGDGVLRFWEASSGRPLWTMPAHKSRLVGVRVEGNDIVTRGFSGDISRWTLPNPEQVIDACGRHERCAIVAK